MKHILLFGLMLASFFSYSQYPASGVKQRLGWQTTGDGLVYRGAIADTSTLDPSGLNNAWMLLDTVSGNLYAYRSKAWQLVSGGGGGVSMPFDSVTFNINEGDASEQELKYSAEKGYLQYGGLDSVQIPLLPGIWYVRNDTSVTIPKGTVVRATGTLGASGRIKVKHMIANGTIPAMYVLGIAMQDIAVGADGYVMTQGKIRQVNTAAYSEGAVLYADVDTLGGLTQTEPGNGYLKLPIAFVVHSASNGVLAVRVNPGLYLRDLHDVDTTGRVGGSVLQYDSALKYWKASTTAGIVAGDTSVFARDFQISGTPNYLPKFAAPSNLVSSVLFDTLSRIGLNTVTPARSLHINATDAIRIPVGTVAQRGVGTSGDLRFNSDSTTVEFHDGTGWRRFLQTQNPNGRGTANNIFYADANGRATDESTFTFNATGKYLYINKSIDTTTIVTNGTASSFIKINNLGSGIGIINPGGINPGSQTYFTISSGAATGFRIYVGNVYRAFELSNQGLFSSYHNTNGANANYYADRSDGYAGFNLFDNTGNPRASAIWSNSAATVLPSSFIIGPRTTTGSFHMITGSLTTPRATITPTGLFGIGVQTPVNRLDVEGNMAIGATYSGTTAAPTNGLIVEGNTGIGTSSPQRRLHVTGTVRVDTLTRDVPTRVLGADADGDLAAVTLGTGLSIASGTLNTSAILPADTSVFARDWQIAGTANYLPKFTGASSVGNSVVYESGGNIGIGTTSTGTKLVVVGGINNVVGALNVSATFSDAVNSSLYISHPGGTNNTATIVGNYQLGLATSTGTVTTERVRVADNGRVGIATTSPARTLHVAGEARITDLTTDTPTRIVGADADGDLGAITLGTGLSITSGTLNASGITSVYIPLNVFAIGDTLTTTVNSKEYFLVHSGLNGYCIDSYTVKAIAGTGTADIQLDKNGSGANLQAISGTTVYTKDTNIALVTGDYIRGQVSVTGDTLVGLGLTLEIKATCN